MSGQDRVVRPLCEIGYATRPQRRLEEHSKHQKSNYLMNLTDAICKWKFPQYKIVQYVVFSVVHFTHASFAEILTMAYTPTGTGFCHHPAGQSNSGANPETSGDSALYYKEKRKDLYASEDFQTRVKTEFMKMEEEIQVYVIFAKLLKCNDMEKEDAMHIKLLDLQAHGGIEQKERRLTKDISALIELMDDDWM